MVLRETETICFNCVTSLWLLGHIYFPRFARHNSSMSYQNAREILFQLIKKVNRSECDHLLQFPTNGGKGTIINRREPLAVKTRSATCFALRGERFASSSRLMVLSLLGYKDGTRTIEMTLVSTVLPVIKSLRKLIWQAIRIQVGQKYGNGTACAHAHHNKWIKFSILFFSSATILLFLFSKMSLHHSPFFGVYLSVIFCVTKHIKLMFTLS